MKKSSWMLSAVALGGFAAQGLAQEAKPMPAPAAPAVTSAPIVLSSDCCNSCNSCCDDGCGRGGSILADVSFMILKPYWKTNPAMTVATTNAAGVDVEEQIDFGDAKQFVPRIALGYVGGNGIGARLGWWGFATSQAVNTPNADGDLSIFSAAPLDADLLDIIGGTGAFYALRMDVWDLEAVRTFGSGSAQGLVSAGIRYAHVSMDYNAVNLRGLGPNTGLPAEVLVSGHNFNGAGPTLGFQGRYGETLYGAGALRGSLLFGEGKQNVAIVDGGFIDPTLELVDVRTSTYDAIIPVVEMELGVGVRRNAFFAEAGFNAQAWIDAGNPSRSAGDNGSYDSTLGLFGFYLKAGLTY